MKIDMNVNTKNDEFKDAVSVAANVDIMEDANEQLESVKNVEVTTKYVDIVKLPIETRNMLIWLLRM